MHCDQQNSHHSQFATAFGMFCYHTIIQFTFFSVDPGKTRFTITKNTTTWLLREIEPEPPRHVGLDIRDAEEEASVGWSR